MEPKQLEKSTLLMVTNDIFGIFSGLHTIATRSTIENIIKRNIPNLLSDKRWAGIIQNFFRQCSGDSNASARSTEWYHWNKKRRNLMIRTLGHQIHNYLAFSPHLCSFCGLYSSQCIFNDNTLGKGGQKSINMTKIDTKKYANHQNKC